MLLYLWRWIEVEIQQILLFLIHNISNFQFCLASFFLDLYKSKLSWNVFMSYYIFTFYQKIGIKWIHWWMHSLPSSACAFKGGGLSCGFELKGKSFPGRLKLIIPSHAKCQTLFYFAQGNYFSYGYNYYSIDIMFSYILPSKMLWHIE